MSEITLPGSGKKVTYKKYFTFQVKALKASFREKELTYKANRIR